MTPVPRILESIDKLQRSRTNDFINIFSTIAHRNRNIQVMNFSIRGNLIFAIADAWESGQNFTDWRFQTISKNIRASYHEIWNDHGKGKYFLERSYFHLYILVEEDFKEEEYILLHCDASEPAASIHSIYKQSPHIHVKAAPHPIPKAHIALYNSCLPEVLKSRTSFNRALSESISMLNSEILQAHPLL